MKILLYKGVTPVSQIIRWFTNSDYSHVALELDDGSVVEAWHTGVVHVKDFKENHTKGTIVDSYIINDNAFSYDKTLSYKLIKEKALSLIGKKYDFKGVAGFISRSNIQNEQRLFCSELVIACLIAANIFLLKRIKPSETSPRDVSLSPFLNYFESRIC